MACFRFIRVWLLLWPLLLFGCGPLLGLEEGRLQGDCETRDECAPGFICVRGQCSPTCDGDRDCPEGQACAPVSNRMVCTAIEAACDDDEPDCVMQPEAPPEIVTPGAGEACDRVDDLACGGPASKYKLICDGFSWQRNGTCDDGENCNRQTGGCADIVPACAEAGPSQLVCDGQALVRCGPDLVSTVPQACDGPCVSGEGEPRCARAGCGDGETVAPEQCDDANSDNTDDCTALCTLPRCGDGFVWADHEECDDANDNDGDACTNSCTIARCGDGSVQSGQEDCDDGNGVDDDACNNACRRAGCGDGKLAAGEQCDDGNDVSGDGCSDRCAVEATAITTGNNYTCALLSTGAIKCWGENAYGQLGLGDNRDRGDMPNELGAGLPPLDLGEVGPLRQISAGDYHTCGLFEDDSLKCWGLNAGGQLGLGDNEWRGDQTRDMGDALPTVDLGGVPLEVKSGSALTCARLEGGVLKCWGFAPNGELGAGNTITRGDNRGEMGTALKPVALGTGRTAVEVAPGWAHTCVVLDDASVKCWGLNEDGQLGAGDRSRRGDGPGEMGDDLAPVDLGEGRGAALVATGLQHSCAVLLDGAVKCWGGSTNGELGLGDTKSRGDGPGEMGDALPEVDLGGRALTVTVGWAHTCALLEDGRVKCWGFNHAGQLGQGDDRTRGDEPGEMGEALPAVDLGSGRRALQLTTGANHNCVLLDDGTVKCWGLNFNGQLGLGDNNDRGDGPGEMGDQLSAVSL